MGCPAGIVGLPFIITPLEIYFKITIGILYVCLGYIRFLYRKPYQQVKKTILYRIHLKREKKLVAMVAWGFNVPYIVYLFTPWFDGATLQIGTGIRCAGIVLVLGALWLFWAAHKVLGSNWSPLLEIREKHQLITTGIYQHIRHPMYTALYLFIIGAGAISANVLLLVVPFITFSVLCYIRISDEEKMMINWFGDEYWLYKNKTGMFLPKWHLQKPY